MLLVLKIGSQYFAFYLPTMHSLASSLLFQFLHQLWKVAPWSSVMVRHASSCEPHSFLFLSGNLFSFLLWFLALSFYSTNFSAFFLGASSFSACLGLAFYKLSHAKRLASTDLCGTPDCFCIQLSSLSPCIAPGIAWVELHFLGKEQITQPSPMKKSLVLLAPQLPK